MPALSPKNDSGAYVTSVRVDHGRRNILSILPLELRNTIWSLTMPIGETLSIHRSTNGEDMVDNVKTFFSPPLTLVCRQIREESAKLFYSSNKFVVRTVTSGSIPQCRVIKWLLNLPQSHYAAIRTLEVELTIEQKARFAPRLGVTTPYRAVITMEVGRDVTIQVKFQGAVQPLERLEVKRVAQKIERTMQTTGSTQKGLGMAIFGLREYYLQWSSGTPSKEDMEHCEIWLKMLYAGISPQDIDMEECIQTRLGIVRAAISILSWS
ncbi:hypothetical protein BDV97DRAFT_349520 [Delphinella strobiligena]|nr:hypothetical protein BDV97DRAFT_349520 [Delphinella strobiligena]